MPFQPERLRQLLQQHKLKNYELAEQIGVTPAMISAYLNGTKAPRQNTLEKMADTLRTQVSYLMGRGENGTDSRVVRGGVRPVPLLGRISAGPGLVATEEVETMVVLPEVLMNPTKEYFLLHVSGDSMNRDGIHDGDQILVERTDNLERSDVGVILVSGDEAVLARVERDGDRIALRKSNPECPTMYVGADEYRVIGVARKKISDI